MNLRALEDDVADEFLYLRNRQRYSRDGAVYLIQRKFRLSRAVVIDILSYTIRNF